MSKEKKQFQSEKDVMNFYKEDPKLNQVVIFENVVYNVSEYKNLHPGGASYLEENFGKNIDEIFAEYEHTISAKSIFRDLPQVGVCLEGVSTDDNNSDDQDDTFSFDYSQPLVMQLFRKNWTFEQYIKFINEPKVLLNPVRDLTLFYNPILEYGSKAPWYAVPIVWGLNAIYWYTKIELNSLMFLVWATLGFFSWTLMEYLVHRWVFHGEEDWLNKLAWGRYTWTGHFLMHGIHHAFPQDRLRLTFPPIPGMAIVYLLAIVPYWSILPQEVFSTFCFGIILGYISYEMMHYYVHHGSPSKGTHLNDMKMYHLQHHYKNGTIGFGVTSKGWDYIFDTRINEIHKQSEQKQN